MLVTGLTLPFLPEGRLLIGGFQLKTKLPLTFMNLKTASLGLLLVSFLVVGPQSLRAQGSVFTYQGRILDTGSPANGTNYDLMFSLFNSVTNGSQIGSSVQLFGVTISNGLFTVPLNFGQQPFNGSNLWMEIAVQKNGGGFLILTPRQQLTSSPYAIMANAAGNLVGALPSNGLSGVYSSAVSFTNGGNTFTGTYSGNGNGLTNLNASQLITGTVPAARLPTNVALLNAVETFTSPVTFLTSGVNSNAISGSNNATAGSGGGSGIFGTTSQANGGGIVGKNLNASGTGVIAIGNGTSGSSLVAGSGLAADGSVVGLYARAEGTTLPAAAIYAALGSLQPLYINYYDGSTQFKLNGLGTVATLVSDPSSKIRVMFAPEAPEVLFEDYGSGRLTGGKAHVALDPIFAANISVDQSHPLRVFVQVEDDCKGVYVSNKTPAGFDVVELAGGASSAPFSWHVAANRADEEFDSPALGTNAAAGKKQVSHYSTLRFPVRTNSPATWHPIKTETP